MKRIIGAGVLGLLLLAQTGCIAVSAKEISSATRYEAVAAEDGRIYVVDKKCRTAREVEILSDQQVGD